MKAKPYYNSGFLSVYPRSAGNYGFCSISGIEYEDDSHLEEMKEQIERHVDRVQNVYIEYEQYQCSKCEDIWNSEKEAEDCCGE
jgi:hypothetical protein